MSKIKLLAFIIAVVFGVLLFVYGGADDSPGAQGLGLLLAAGGIVMAWRSRNK